MTILNLIEENKTTLFGKFYGKLTFDLKTKKWKEISQKLHEQGIYDKDWKYLRDTTWQNWRKRTIEKLDNRRQTGSAGGKKCKFDEADDKILDIIGKNTPVLEGLDVPEASGTQDTIQPSNIQPSNIETTLHITPKNTKSIIRLKKEKLEAEMLLTNEKIEIAKREKYKLELEIYKLEKELNIRVSTFTEQFHEQDTIEIIS